MRRRRVTALTSMLLIAAACGTGLPSATELPPVPLTQVQPTLPAEANQPSPPASASAPVETPTAPAAPGEPVFTVGVLVDTRTQQVSRDQAQALINEAGLHLRPLAPVIMVMTDFVEDGGGGSTTEILQRYMIAHASALPNGMVIFSFGDGEQAKRTGGYAYSAPAPGGYRNSFASPIAGDAQIYVAVIDYSFKYMACGYAGSDAVKSATALDGECGNQPGTACVQQNGYSMCASAVGHLYMSTPTYFAASWIIHELLQPFAPNGAKDDYSTPECTSRMGYPAGFRDLQESQYHNDLCPFVYEDFLKSYRP